ncbi:hypothetical protein FSP39_021889 [Pinctada imbricata]|uniref:Glucans biosynthesis glucosyltransferase H n=1 Tax=Pinctada imbricata TaxID=66713 RepID=A0AA88YAD6_PINIB|nr:hypothetical protein FSP39_021889 [Pinctada imbricata]
MERKFKLILYFTSWIILAIFAVILNFLNINFDRTHYATGVVLTLILGIVQGSVLEYPVQTIACLIVGGWKRDVPRAHSFSRTLIMNYNLLAYSQEEIDECMEMMYKAYMGNLSPKISAVLVSATSDDLLRGYELFTRDYYRSNIFDELYSEGLAFCRGEYAAIDNLHFQHVWSQYQHIDPNEFKRVYLPQICNRFAKEFMVIHRVSRVLRKCGQYQDLMLLSSGDNRAYTYCDIALYSRAARKYNEPLFYENEDVTNILGRHFDYTLVLDADTGVPRKTAYELLKIAEAHPDRGIIQPAINLQCQKRDTIFMHLECMRQTLNEPLTNSNAAIFEQSSYFGKALIRNDIYINKVLGTREHLIECVPIDVLSHDTFEAALLQPLYVGTVFLEEAPCYNYVSWNIRERRWNRGEILLAIYFWKTCFGKPMRWLQKKFQRERFVKTQLRTESKLDFVSAHIAHAAIRQMIMKPLLLLFVLIHIGVELKYQYAPIIIIMFFVLIFPKFATCNCGNLKFVIVETIASILQFTPEAATGCIRIIRAFEANICASAKWVPQRTVEQEFHNCNAFVSSFKHLWGYSFCALICSILVLVLYMPGYLVVFMFATLVVLPLYTGFTSLPLGYMARYRARVEDEETGISHAQRKNIYRKVSSTCTSKSTHYSQSSTPSQSSQKSLLRWLDPNNDIPIGSRA